MWRFKSVQNYEMSFIENMILFSEATSKRQNILDVVLLAWNATISLEF